MADQKPTDTSQLDRTDRTDSEVPVYGNPNPNLYQNNAYVYGDNPYGANNAFPNQYTPNTQNQLPMNPNPGYSPYGNQPRGGYVPPNAYVPQGYQNAPTMMVVVDPIANLDPNSREYRAEVLAEKIRYGFPCFVWGNYCWMFFSIFFFFFEDVHYIVSLLFAIVCNVIGIVAASVGNDALRKCSQKRLGIYFNLLAIYFLSLIARSVYLIIENGLSGVFIFTYNAILPLVLWSIALEIKKTIHSRDLLLNS